MFGNASWVVLVVVLSLIYYVASIRERLLSVEQKLDAVLRNFEGLRQYLYSIDPQFDDERKSNEDLEDERNLYAPMNDMELLDRKRSAGRRTLNTSFDE